MRQLLNNYLWDTNPMNNINYLMIDAIPPFIQSFILLISGDQSTKNGINYNLS